jgi:hypothetical protein
MTKAERPMTKRFKSPKVKSHPSEPPPLVQISHPGNAVGHSGFVSRRGNFAVHVKRPPARNRRTPDGDFCAPDMSRRTPAAAGRARALTAGTPGGRKCAPDIIRRTADAASGTPDTVRRTPDGVRRTSDVDRCMQFSGLCIFQVSAVFLG